MTIRPPGSAFLSNRTAVEGTAADRGVTEVTTVELNSYHVGDGGKTQSLIPPTVRRVGIAHFHDEASAVENPRPGVNRLRVIRRGGPAEGR